MEIGAVNLFQFVSTEFSVSHVCCWVFGSVHRGYIYESEQSSNIQGHHLELVDLIRYFRLDRHWLVILLRRYPFVVFSRNVAVYLTTHFHQATVPFNWNGKLESTKNVKRIQCLQCFHHPEIPVQGINSLLQLRPLLLHGSRVGTIRFD